MLCPECQQAAPGGSLCPQCGQPVPEKEIFGGQGSHYLVVLALLSLVLFAAFSLIIGRRLGFEAAVWAFHRSDWFWFYLAVSLLPFAVGLYYWALLRDEETTVTDSHITRRSHWGQEELAWTDVEDYISKPILPRQTRLGRITWFSRLFTQQRLIARIPLLRYELISRADALGGRHTMILEPGTIDDMSWLLRIIEERIGPPREG